MTQTSALGHADLIRRFLDHMVARRWEAMADCLSADVVRIGPYGDTYSPREAYVSFLSDLLPRLSNYRMEVSRVVVDEASGTGLAELAETLDLDGGSVRTPEALVFDFGDDGRIARIAVYIQEGMR
ncbi:MAG: nuclear transport factor 2 family protein [Acidimicrobiales bacterium]